MTSKGIVWITGCRGFLGGEMVDRFEKAGYNVVGTDVELSITEGDRLRAFAEEVQAEHRGELRRHPPRGHHARHARESLTRRTLLARRTSRLPLTRWARSIVQAVLGRRLPREAGRAR